MRIWDKSRPRRAKLTLRGHSDVVYRVCFSPNGRVILSASEDGTMRAWDRHEGYTLWVYRVSTPAAWGAVACEVVVVYGCVGLCLWHGGDLGCDTAVAFVVTRRDRAIRRE